MTEGSEHISNRRLRTPRAAAIAGIFFALLYSAGYVLIQLSLPAISGNSDVFSEDAIKSISLGLSLLPFAGIAFLWFMGVIRDSLGNLEDQFFSTLFFASGILYLGMSFAAAAVAGGMLFAYGIDPELVGGSEGVLLTQAIVDRINTIYSVRMAGMFMTVLGTIWIRTQVMPRWLAFITFIFAIILLISIGFTKWVVLVFPVWVFLTSVYFLFLNFKKRTDQETNTLNIGNK
jgi:hypothetical protein